MIYFFLLLAQMTQHNKILDCLENNPQFPKNATKTSIKSKFVCCNPLEKYFGTFLSFQSTFNIYVYPCYAVLKLFIKSQSIERKNSISWKFQFENRLFFNLNKRYRSF